MELGSLAGSKLCFYRFPIREFYLPHTTKHPSLIGESNRFAGNFTFGDWCWETKQTGGLVCYLECLGLTPLTQAGRVEWGVFWFPVVVGVRAQGIPTFPFSLVSWYRFVDLHWWVSGNFNTGLGV